MGLSPSVKVFLNKLWWLAYGKTTSVYDMTFYLLKIPYKRVTVNQNEYDSPQEKVIVYIGEFLPPRIARMAKWSKRFAPFTTILLCHKRGFVEKFSNKDIDKLLLFRNEWHLKRLIKAIPTPYIVHGFAPKSKYPYLAMKALRINSFSRKDAKAQRASSPPFVIDYQDVFAVYYGTEPKFPWLKEELPYEKACLMEADGIVANSLEPREGIRIWNIKKHGKRLFFPLYCDNDYFATVVSHKSSVVMDKSPITNKTSTLTTYDLRLTTTLTTYDLRLTTNDDLHLVYAGGVNGSHRDRVHYGATQMHWLIDYLTAQKIHFHIYPSPSVIKADYEEYEEIAKNSTYFHYHSPVSQTKLHEELSKYHYGLMPFFYMNSGQSELKHKYATTLKLFNYIEAGIPILVGADVGYQSWLVNRYSLGITVPKKEDFKDVRKIIGVTPYEEQVKKLIESRENLSLKKHIPRLLEFYERLQKQQPLL